MENKKSCRPDATPKPLPSGSIPSTRESASRLRMPRKSPFKHHRFARDIILCAGRSMRIRCEWPDDRFSPDRAAGCESCQGLSAQGDRTCSAAPTKPTPTPTSSARSIADMTRMSIENGETRGSRAPMPRSNGAPDIARASAHGEPQRRNRAHQGSIRARRMTERAAPISTQSQSNHATILFVFIDETSVKTNLTRLRGCRLCGKGLEMSAPLVIKGAMDGEAVAAYIRRVLAPDLLPRTVVICDDLATHRNKGAAQALKDAGCWFLYLPPYSPDLNPIEMAFSKLKAHLRRIGARPLDHMFDALAEICDLIHTARMLECLLCGRLWIRSKARSFRGMIWPGHRFEGGYCP